jgi:hypothetical protein
MGRSSPFPVVQLYIHKQLLVFMTIPCWLDLQSGWCCGSVLFSMGQRTHHTEPLWACPLWEGGCMVRKCNSNAGNIFVIQVTQNRSLYCITTPQIQSIDSLKKPTQGLSLLVVLLDWILGYSGLIACNWSHWNSLWVKGVVSLFNTDVQIPSERLTNLTNNYKHRSMSAS